MEDFAHFLSHHVDHGKYDHLYVDYFVFILSIFSRAKWDTFKCKNIASESEKPFGMVTSIYELKYVKIFKYTGQIMIMILALIKKDWRVKLPWQEASKCNLVCKHVTDNTTKGPLLAFLNVISERFYCSFYSFSEARVIPFDIWKTFDRVW